MPQFALVIPVLNEQRFLPRLLDRLLPLADAEILLVDGGSSDGTIEMSQRIAAEHPQVRLLHSARGRGCQMRHGAAASSAETLVFLHADSLPADNLAATLNKFHAKGLEAATFRLRFDSDNVWLKLFALAARLDTSLTRFGDQGLVIQRALYDECGGFADVPLFEDVLLFTEIRRRSKLAYLDADIITSSRRFAERGPLRQMLRNIRLYTAWKLGRPIEELAEIYQNGVRQK